MEEQFLRNTLYWGEDFQKSLSNRCVAILGLGGVGGYTLEALARAGVLKFILVDFDIVSKSNINRQIVALHSNIGEKKTSAFQKRLKDINPEIQLKIIDDFYDETLNDEIFNNNAEFHPDFVVDAIDTLRSKIGLLTYCSENKINVVSSMGAGNRVDATKLFITEIENFKPNCQFGKNILSKLNKNGINKGITVVSSSEKPKNLKKLENLEQIIKKDGTKIEFKKFTPASTPIVPAVAGYLMANVIILKWLNSSLPSKCL